MENTLIKQILKWNFIQTELSASMRAEIFVYRSEIVK